MNSMRYAFIVALALVTGTAATVAPAAAARTVGQVIDDTVITTEVKTKLAADKLSNLTRIEVRTNDGIVSLNGTVEDAERRARAAQIASTVDGVRGIVNNIHVAGSTVPAQPIATTPIPPVAGSVPGTIDATGVVAAADPATGTITLQDGRVLRVTNQTLVWQAGTLHGLRPGSHVMVRDATPVGVQPSTAAVTPEWRMGTVRSVDRNAGLLVLSDGTVVRVSPSALVRRGNERIGIDSIAPGSEVVIRTFARPVTGAEGSALPGRTATVDASEISVVWSPVSIR